MAGLGIKVYTDEDVDASLARELRNLGYDALSCHEAGNQNQGFSDEYQLRYARDHDLAIVVHNAKHFRRLVAEWIARGEEHSGVMAINQAGPAELVRRVRIHLDTVAPTQQYNRMLSIAP
jgi:hypothetical protein